jgi:phosphoglycolate phosphatase-like HAD superfamily hydrolase
MPVAVRWGYLGTGPALEEWNADAVIAEPDEVLKYLA